MGRMKRPASIIVAVLVAASCAAPGGPPAPKDTPLADLPAIDTNAILADTRALSADEFEGREPGSPGEEKTIAYLTDAAKKIGLEPGNPDGTYIQKVPLVGLTPEKISPLVVKRSGKTLTLKHHDQFIAFSQRVTDKIDLNDSELVFAGYGVQAPEYKWDDFKGLDVKGKTIVVLVGDPPVVDAASTATPKPLDKKTFGGDAMTYYGRWTYKYEKAAELGAAGVLIVHETGPAGYPFSVVQGFGGQRFDLITPDKNMGRAAVQGWLSLEAATALMKLAGQDYDKLKAAALSPDFKPVSLGATASMNFTQIQRTVDSRNVIAKITGADPALKNEYVIYSAHWDHLGIGDPVNGDKIYNGAVDNASGSAMTLEIARAFKKVQPQPKRSIVFLWVTAEEQGLLGSGYYASFPLYPLAKTLANINIDEINPWGRTKDLTIVGLGASDLDDYTRDAAAEQGRVLKPDAEPQKGFYYRSDHFNFAKHGVPALDPDDGVDFIGKPDGYGKAKREQWSNVDYHQPSDVVKSDWDLTGAAEDGKVLFAVGYRVANAARFPEWKNGNEFKATRDKMLGR